MKTFIALIAISCSASLLGYSQKETGIKFESVSFSKLLAKAKKEHKLVFIDGYTTWCGPCKWMSKNIFPNDTVAQYYNSHFICAAIDMEKGEGIELAKKYEVHCYPTYLFIDADGNLVHRKSGTSTVQEFIGVGNVALNPTNRFSSLKTNYEAEKISSPDLVRYMHFRQASCLSVDTQMTTYFNSEASALLNNPDTWIMLRDFSNGIQSKAFQFLLSNREYFFAQHTADSVDQVMERVYGGAMGNCLYAKGGLDTIGYLKIKKEIIDGKFSFSESLTLQGDISFYQITKEWKLYSQTTVLYVNKYVEKDDWNTLNSIAWEFYENIDDSIYLDTAIAWAKRSVAIDENYFNTDTYAALLYKRGKLAESKIQLEKAIELAKEDEIECDETKEMLKKINGLKTKKK